MELTLLHAGLAAGALLASIPIIIHLLHRQPPKRVIFPALRLVRQRNKRTSKRLRIKNWLLLAARMLLIALMALALARPALHTRTPLGDSEVPTALGLVFDTSLSMTFTERGSDRLAEAKKEALAILAKLPETSQVFVIDSAEPGVPPPLSPSAAKARVEALGIRPANRLLNTAVGQAYQAVAGSDRPRREVYVLTDLARSSWDLGRPVENLDKAQKLKDAIATYVLRLTPKDVRDAAVIEAEPIVGGSMAIAGEPIEVRAVIRNTGPAAKRVAEFAVDGTKREQKPLDLPADKETSVSFRAPALPVGTHQARISLTGGVDPLAFDDVRSLTFQVRPPLYVLVMSDLEVDAEFLANALDPSARDSGEPRPYRVDRILTSQFARKSESFDDYSAIFLNNVEAPSEAVWARLVAYVRRGGGLVIGLGDRCRPDAYNGSLAAQVLPAALVKAETPSADSTFGRIVDPTHPLFNRFAQEIGEDLGGVPVMRWWSLTPSAGSRTLFTIAAGDAPALIERIQPGARTAGHVLLWSTPLARRPDAQDRSAWNNFPLFWSFLAMVDQSVAYVAGVGSTRLDYEAGQDVILPLSPERRAANYLIQAPDGKTSERLSPSAGATSLIVVSPQVLGPWTVTADTAKNEDADETKARPKGPEVGGFSINPPESETRFVALGTKDLDMLLGKERYALADSPDDLKRAVGLVRVGREVFPWLMVLILLLLAAENLLANRFHREVRNAQTTPPPSIVAVESGAHA